MTTLRKWFDRFTEETGEKVEVVCFGGGRWYGSEDEPRQGWPAYPVNVATPVDLIDAAVFDRDFDAGFGGNESPNLCAWSASYVVFSDNYDGAEDIRWVPRNPSDHTPARPGGG